MWNFTHIHINTYTCINYTCIRASSAFETLETTYIHTYIHIYVCTYMYKLYLYTGFKRIQNTRNYIHTYIQTNAHACINYTCIRASSAFKIREIT